MKKTIHTGVVKDGEKFTYYIVDDKDSLPPDIREYATQRITNGFSFWEMFQRINDGENIDNYRYVVQIGELYYETVEVVDGE